MVAITIRFDSNSLLRSLLRESKTSGQRFELAAITLWNTVYLERATEQMTRSWQFNPALLQHVSPLGWEHINLTGDYTTHTKKRVAKWRFRPLRSPRNPSGAPYRT